MLHVAYVFIRCSGKYYHTIQVDKCKLPFHCEFYDFYRPLKGAWRVLQSIEYALETIKAVMRCECRFIVTWLVSLDLPIFTVCV